MLRTRLLVGFPLAILMGGVLVGDSYLMPYFPCLFLCVAGLGWLAAGEFRAMLPPADRPHLGLCRAGILAAIAVNWLPLVDDRLRPWPLLAGVVAGVVLVGFLREMAIFTAPGGHVTRIAHLVLAVGYLGVLPAFLVRLRMENPADGPWLVALAVFVPKCADIGAYFAGRAFGRTPFAPKLSPKKTWEGFTGGTVLAMTVAVVVGIYNLRLFPRQMPEAALFGLLIGTAGVLGDLAESMLKRDAGAKDASATVPGFGGVLDVIDSVLFAAPLVYLWFEMR